MKRFKVMSLTAFVVILCYIFTLGVSYYYSYNKVTSDMFNAFGDLRNILIDSLSFESSESAMIQQVRTFNTPYQSVIALFDEDKKLIAKTENLVTVTLYEDGSQFTVVLDDYMTDDIVKEIAEFSKNRTPYIESLSVIETDYEIKPAELVLVKPSQLSAVSPEVLRVVFNDYTEPTAVYEANQNSVYLDYRTHNICQYNDEFKIRDELENIFIRYRLSLEGEWSGPWAKIGENNMLTVSDFKNAEGNKYTFFYTAGYDIFHSVIRSGYFSDTALTLGILFAFIFVIAELAALLTYNRNRRITKAREAFIAGAAHELKTPLAVISNQCECVLENVAPEKNGEYINSVYSEAKRMNRMVMSLIQFNKLSTDGKIKREKVNINDIASQEAEKYKALIEAKNINLCEQYCEKAVIKADSELISLALDNFISNAVKFTPEGGTVTITTQKSRRKVVLSVHNTGSHIADEDKAHIWEELYRGDKARQRQGSTGMGLAICRKIFELHSFKYGFENTEDGVRFYFTE